MKKHAFTMIELVFVIVIIGIMTALVIPRLDRDLRFEAASQVVEHIKFTQHLAMTEDRYDHTIANWFFRRWQIQFYNCGGYVVHSPTNVLAPNAAPAQANAALDPQSGKFLFIDNLCTMPMAPANYEKVNLTGFYDVNRANGIVVGGGCNGATIAFDTLGRPYDGNGAVNGVATTDCTVTLNFNNGAPEIIRIYAETGHVCLQDAAGDCI